MTQIYKYDELDLSKIDVAIPDKQNDIYYSPLKYDGKPFYLQTSKLDIVTNCNELNGKNPSIEFEIPKNNLDIYNTFNDLDEKLIRTTYDNSVPWFKQKIPLDVIDDMYKRLCKPIKKNKNPSIRFKLPVIKNKIVCKIYNQNKQFIGVEDIKRDSSGILILHIRGIRFMRQQYSYDIYITQMKVFIPIENKYIIPEECLIQEDFCTQSDDEIVDDEAIKEIKQIQEFKIKKKNEEMEKIKELQKQLEEMNKNLDNLG